MADRPLQRTLYGVEGDATPGTIVDASRRVAGATVEWDVEDENYYPDHPIGIYTLNATNPIPVKRGTNMRWGGDLNLEEIVDILEMGVKELAVPSGTGPYTWTFDPSEAAANDPRTYSFKRRLSDGASNFHAQAGFVFCKSFTISQNVNESSKLTAELMGRRVQAWTPTGPELALAVPTLNFVAGSAWAVWIDDAAPASPYGTTAVTGQVRSFEFTFNTGLFEKYYLDGRSDLDFSATGTGRRGIERLRLQVEWAAQAETERTAARANNIRRVRLKNTIGTLSIQFDMAVRHVKPDFLSVSDENGNDVTDLELTAAYDNTGAQHFTAVVVNNRATL